MTELILTIRPQPFSTMSATTCLVTLNMEFRLVSITVCQSSGVILMNMRSRVMPALFTSTSTVPCSALVLAKASTVDSQLPTLPTEA
ncbi:hypothetical protein D3C71_1598480 [compost metagenome]